jgi:hypothetical protein
MSLITTFNLTGFVSVNVSNCTNAVTQLNKKIKQKQIHVSAIVSDRVAAHIATSRSAMSNYDVQQLVDKSIVKWLQEYKDYPASIEVQLHKTLYSRRKFILVIMKSKKDLEWF